jgi:hypothetical protein
MDYIYLQRGQLALGQLGMDGCVWFCSILTVTVPLIYLYCMILSLIFNWLWMVKKYLPYFFFVAWKSVSRLLVSTVIWSSLWSLCSGWCTYGMWHETTDVCNCVF